MVVSLFGTRNKAEIESFRGMALVSYITFCEILSERAGKMLEKEENTASG